MNRGSGHIVHVLSVRNKMLDYIMRILWEGITEGELINGCDASLLWEYHDPKE